MVGQLIRLELAAWNWIGAAAGCTRSGLLDPQPREQNAAGANAFAEHVALKLLADWAFQRTLTVGSEIEASLAMERLALDSTVGLISPHDLKNEDDQAVILNGIQDPPVAHTDPEQVVEPVAHQLLATSRPGFSR